MTPRFSGKASRFSAKSAPPLWPPKETKAKKRKAPERPPVLLPYAWRVCRAAETGLPFLEVDLPIVPWNEGNARGKNPYAKADRVKAQKEAAATLLAKPLRMATLPMRVTFTTLRAVRFDDDNNVMSCKHIRDVIAKLMGTNDGPNSPIQFAVAPPVSTGTKANLFGFRVRIEMTGKGRE